MDPSQWDDQRPDVRELLIAYLREGSTAKARVEILRTLDDKGDLAELALGAFRDVHNPSIVRKVAIEQYELRTSPTDRFATYSSSIANESDPLVASTLAIFLGHAAAEGTTEQRRDVLTVYDGLLRAHSSNEQVMTSVLRSTSLLDSSESVDYLGGMVVTPDVGDQQRAAALRAMHVYASSSPHIGKRFEFTVRALDCDSRQVKEAAALVLADAINRSSFTFDDETRLRINDRLRSIYEQSSDALIRSVLKGIGTRP